MHQVGRSYGELIQKHEELSDIAKQIEKLNSTKMSREEMVKLVQSAEEKIDFLANERAKFIGHCNNYINLRRGHAQELRKNGIITYIKAKEE